MEPFVYAIVVIVTLAVQVWLVSHWLSHTREVERLLTEIAAALKR